MQLQAIRMGCKVSKSSQPLPFLSVSGWLFPPWQVRAGNAKGAPLGLIEAEKVKVWLIFKPIL